MNIEQQAKGETTKNQKTRLKNQIIQMDAKIQFKLEDKTISTKKRTALRNKRKKLDSLRVRLKKTNQVTNREINFIRSGAFDDLRKVFAHNYVEENNAFADHESNLLTTTCVKNVFALMKNGEKYTKTFKARQNIKYQKGTFGIIDASVIGLKIEKKGSKLIITQEVQSLRKSPKKKVKKEFTTTTNTYSFSKGKIERKGDNVTADYYTEDVNKMPKTNLPIRNAQYTKINGNTATLQNINNNVQVQDVLAPSLNQELILIRNGVPQIIVQKGYTWISTNVHNKKDKRVRVYNGDKIQALADMPKQTIQKLAGSKYYVEKDKTGKLNILKKESLNALNNLPNNEKKLKKMKNLLKTSIAEKGWADNKPNRAITKIFKSIGETGRMIWDKVSKERRRKISGKTNLGSPNLNLLITQQGQFRLEKNGKLQLAYKDSGFYSFINKTPRTMLAKNKKKQAPKKKA